MEEHQVTGPDGSTFTASLYHVIDADRDPELLKRLGMGALNRVLCPSTGQYVESDRSVLVVSARARLAFLVVPESRWEQAVEQRIELLQELAKEHDPVPNWLLDFRAIRAAFGVEDLHRARERRDLADQLTQERERLEQAVRAITTERNRLRNWAYDLSRRERSLRRAELTLGANASDDGPTDVTGDPDSGVAHEDAADLDPVEDDTTAVHFASPYVDLSETIEILTSSEIEIIDGPHAEPDPRGLDGVPTEGGAEPDDRANGGAEASSFDEEVTGRFEDPTPAPESADTSTETGQVIELMPARIPSHMADLPAGHGRISVDGGGIALHFVVDRPRQRAFTEREPKTLLQLHRLPSYPIVNILLAVPDATGVVADELFCILDIEDETDRALLDRLSEAYQFEVYIYDESGRRVRFLRCREPLEHNVDHVVARAVKWLADLDPDQRDFGAAFELFASEGYERIGARKHNFHKSSFARLDSAGAARLAVNVVGYWSEAQNFEYLIENLSFPLDHFRTIQRRVVDGALRYGIAVSKELADQAIALRRATSHADLVEMLVERFGELTAEAPPDFDPMALMENWDQLLAACDDLGLPVDRRLRERAELARRRARRQASSPRIDPTELERTEEYQRPASLDQVPNEDLRALLGRGGVAQAVSRELVGRGGDTNIFYVIEAARVLDDDDIMATARFLAAGADAFEPALLMGLGRVHPRTVHLCALSLALAKREEALPTLIELLHDSDRGGNLPLRDILAEYGAQAIPSLFEAIERRGATEPLVEVLALISIEHGPAIIEALRHHPTEPVLEAAQRMAAVRRELAGRRIDSLTAETPEDEPEPDEGDESP